MCSFFRSSSNAAAPNCPLVERLALLLASTLADKQVLLRFYSRETLMSADARARWVEPDLAPLELKGVIKACAV